MKHAILALALLMAPVVATYADSDTGSVPAFGQGTADLLRLQMSGKQASDNPQALPSAIQEKVVKRYVDSFDHPIPEYFYNKNTFSGSGGGSGGTSH